MFLVNLKDKPRPTTLTAARKALIALKLEALKRQNGYQIVQHNGQRIYEPLPELQIPEPPKGCEVFIGNLPKFVYEDDLIPLFETAGRIYKFRLMLDFSEKTRGYAFATYFNSKDADTAIALMHGLKIIEGAPIAVYRSVDNRRLFVGNIPAEKTKEEIFDLFRPFVDGLVDVILYPDWFNPSQNRGFVFLEFDTHVSASMARRQFHPRNMIGWDQHLYVDWAEPLPNVSPDLMAQVKVLYIRNLPLDYDGDEIHTVFSNICGRANIRKTHKIRSFAFVHFFHRTGAEAAFTALNGREIGNCIIEVEWARPPEFCKKKNYKQTVPELDNFCISVPLYRRKVIREMVRNRSLESRSSDSTVEPFLQGAFYQRPENALPLNHGNDHLLHGVSPVCMLN